MSWGLIALNMSTPDKSDQLHLYDKRTSEAVFFFQAEIIADVDLVMKE